MAAALYALNGVEKANERTGLLSTGQNVNSDIRSSDLISDYKTFTFTHMYYNMYLDYS